MDAAPHGAVPDLALRGRWGCKLGDGFAVARDDHLLAVLDGADEFRKTVFRFGDADIHGFNYSQEIWLFQSLRIRLLALCKLDTVNWSRASD